MLIFFISKNIRKEVDHLFTPHLFYHFQLFFRLYQKNTIIITHRNEDIKLLQLNKNQIIKQTHTISLFFHENKDAVLIH